MNTNDTKRYDSVAEMLHGMGLEPEFVESFERDQASESMSAQLQQSRVEAGITQRELADRLGMTQGAVSKIEHKQDEDLTLKELGSFLSATSNTMHLKIGASQTKAEEIKYHAFQIRHLLDSLADTAGDDKEIKEGVQEFWMEVVVNLTSLLSRSKAVPHDKMAELFKEHAAGKDSSKMNDLRVPGCDKVSAQ